MANCIDTSRTNYFRVTDEEKYKTLFNKLIAEDNIEDFTKVVDGVTYHGFGAYDSIDYQESKDGDYDFDTFLEKMQTILPDDEAFIYFESGHEKLRDVWGYVIVCTKKEIRRMSLTTWAVEQARQILGNNFTTDVYC